MSGQIVQVKNSTKLILSRANCRALVDGALVPRELGWTLELRRNIAVFQLDSIGDEYIQVLRSTALPYRPTLSTNHVGIVLSSSSIYRPCDHRSFTEPPNSAILHSRVPPFHSHLYARFPSLYTLSKAPYPPTPYPPRIDIPLPFLSSSRRSCSRITRPIDSNIGPTSRLHVPVSTNMFERHGSFGAKQYWRKKS